MITAAAAEELTHQKIRVGSSPGKGRGVFALSNFAPGDLIESAPVILFPDDLWWNDEGNTRLNHYSFQWDQGRSCLVLGYGSLYNHAADSNVAYHRGVNQTMEFCAIRRIEAGEELLINYAGNSGKRKLSEYQCAHYGIPEENN